MSWMKSTAGRLIQLVRGTVYFGRILALDQADFSVEHNEVVGLLGANGAGKSTLVKTLIGDYKLDSGEIYFDGKQTEFRSPQDARRYGLETVFQDFSLATNISVYQNFFVGKELTRGYGSLRFRDNRTMKRIARENLHEVGLSPNISMDAPISALSGGERQLIAITRANYFARRLLILDEPFSALSETSVQVVLQLIKKAKERGIAIVLVTHHAPEVFDVADRFVILENGRNIASLRKEDTSMKELEKLLISSRLTVVKEMAAGVAHQIRNPLGVMRVSVDMLRKRFNPGKQRADYEQVVDVLSHEIDNLDQIINNFLAFAHPRKVLKKVWSVRALIQSGINDLSLHKYPDARVSVDLRDPLCEHLCDPNLIRQVISILLLNGIEASGNRGTVEVRAYKIGNELHIDVQDWGCGMDEETMKRIFDPFFTTKILGTGLGLSIVHRIVELHGGRIDVDSSPGGGSIFSLVI